MTFGKKQTAKVLPNPPTAASGHVRKAKPNSTLSKSFLIVMAFFCALQMVQWLVMPIFGRALDRRFDDAVTGKSDTEFGAFVHAPETFLDVVTDKAELGIHKVCATRAIAKYIKPSSAKINLTAWADYGFEERVQRVADYLACSIETTPERFCADTAHQRLVIAITGYLEIQAHVLAKVREQVAIDGFNFRSFGGMPPRSAANVGKTPVLGMEVQSDSMIDPMLLEIDPRIKLAIRRLAEGGVLSESDFSKGLFGSTPQTIQKVFASVKLGAALCEQ